MDESYSGRMQGQPVSIAIIGDNRVGKSSVCYRFFHKRVPSQQYPQYILLFSFLLFSLYPLSSAASFKICDFPRYVSSTMHIYRPTQAVDYFVKPILNHPKISRFAVFDVSVTPQMYVLFFFQSHSQHLTVTTDTAALHA